MGITVLVADKERVFAEAVTVRLEAEQDIEVVAIVHPGPQGEFVIGGRHADVVLLDADLPGGAANSLCAQLTGPPEPSRVIMLSGSSEPERIVAAIRAGASAWVRKDQSFEHLLRVVRGAALGETWLPPAETGTVLGILMREQDQRQKGDMLLAALTPREREILACIADGAERRDVAEQLHLSANTVRTHLCNLMTKLGAHSTLEAVALTRWADAGDLPLPASRASDCPRHVSRGSCQIATAVAAVLAALAAAQSPLVSWNRYVTARPARATIPGIGCTVADRAFPLTNTQANLRQMRMSGG